MLTDRVAQEFLGDLRRFVLRRVRDPVIVEDLVQDILVRVRERRGELRDHRRVAPWLFRIARSVVVDHLRRCRPTEELPELTTEPQEEDRNVEVASWLPAMLAELPKPNAEALTLVEVDGISQRELASRLGLSASGAKSRVQRARRMLAEVLGRCCQIERDRRGNVLDWRCSDPTCR